MGVNRLSHGWPMRRNGAIGTAIGALALVAVCGAPAAAASATPPEQPRALSLRYDIYVGGFYVFAFDATVGLESGAYRVALQGGTAGFIGRLFPWRAWMDSKGSVAAVDPAPEGLAAARFDNVAEWHHKAKRTSVTFESGGRYAIEHDPPEPPPNPHDDPLPGALPLARWIRWRPRSRRSRARRATADARAGCRCSTASAATISSCTTAAA